MQGRGRCSELLAQLLFGFSKMKETWLHPWTQKVDVSSLLTPSMASSLPGTLLAWQEKFHTAGQFKATQRAAAPLDKSIGKMEFDKWMHTYLPPRPAAEDAIPALARTVSELSWLFAYGGSLEAIDLEPGGCASMRIFMKGSLTVLCTPLAGLQANAGPEITSLLEAQKLFTELTENLATLDVYAATFPLPQP